MHFFFLGGGRGGEGEGCGGLCVEVIHMNLFCTQAIFFKGPAWFYPENATILKSCTLWTHIK